jgi:YidC/Oxa1 family membrane protein insertase
MSEQRNLIMTFVLCLAILIGWQVFWPAKQPIRPVAQQQEQGVNKDSMTPIGTAPVPNLPPENRLISLLSAPRVKIATPDLKGSIALTGARIDDIQLTRYHETPDPKSEDITLLSPAAGVGAYYAEFGWVGGADSKLALPGPDTPWSADSETLTPEHPVTLTWDNGQGLLFSRKIAIDDRYMFTLTDKVENKSGAAVSLFPYGLLSRWGTPPLQNITVLHEGPLGVLDGTLKEVKYKKLREDDHTVSQHSTGGWLGFTDKYWLTALAPDQAMQIDARMSWHQVDGVDRYQTDWLGGSQTIENGTSYETTSHLFTGAKELAALDAYSQSLNIPRFDLAIDFGWFYFLTKPFFKLLRLIHSYVPNFGVAILIMTVLIRGLFFPIAQRSFKSMNKMKRLQPEMKRLQEKYADDKVKMQQEVMGLYKKEGVNPISGCLPILLQIPVFFSLYKVLYVTIEMRQAPFFGWIHDLSLPDTTNLFTAFGLIPWTTPSFLHIGILPIIFGASMFMQQKLNPAPTDPVQAKMMQFLPLIFTYTMANFPSGLIIYWTWSNMLSIGQQAFFNKTHPRG